MSQPIPKQSQTAWREMRTSPFFLLGNEILDVFQPIMGRECFTIYSHLVRLAFKNPDLTHSVLELAEFAKMASATVSRSLEVLECLGLIHLTRRGGSQKSKCKLLDSEKAAELLGATYKKSTLSWSLQHEAKQRIDARVEAIRQRQQGKDTQTASNACANQRVRVSQRNAGASPEKRQRATRETQTGVHLIQEELRSEEVPTPTPTPADHSQAQKDKDSPDEDKTDVDLKWATVKFTGVMKDMGSHLFDANRPRNPNLTNGYADWEAFGFNSLAVERVLWRGEVLVLTLSARNPAAAQRGLEKYKKRWDASVRKWFGCEVEISFQHQFAKGERDSSAEFDSFALERINGEIAKVAARLTMP